MASPVLKHTWTKSVANDSGKSVMGDTTIITGSDEKNIGISVDPSVTAVLDMAIDKTKILSFYLVSDQNVTVNTNAADATGGNGFSLAAKKGQGWNNTDAAVSPITQNITKFYIINSGTVTANVRGGFLMSDLE